jgi:hypothetical protein
MVELIKDTVYKFEIVDPYLAEHQQNAYNFIINKFYSEPVFLSKNIKNFMVPLTVNYENALLEAFFNGIKLIDSDFKLPSDFLKAFMAYVSNRNYFNADIHQHLEKSFIGVYYLSVPESKYMHDSNLNGSISFFDKNRKEIMSYCPRQNDLIILRGDVMHSTNYCFSEQFRVSINMGI